MIMDAIESYNILSKNKWNYTNGLLYSVHLMKQYLFYLAESMEYDTKPVITPHSQGWKNSRAKIQDSNMQWNAVFETVLKSLLLFFHVDVLNGLAWKDRTLYFYHISHCPFHATPFTQVIYEF